MFGKLTISQTANALAAHASARQALVAANVANADTPGYRAQDLGSFAQGYADAQAGSGLRATRPGHLAPGTAPGTGGQLARVVEASTSASPNGNTVSLEDEMLRGADVRQQHDLALSVMRATSDILRASLGRIS